ncbi:MAG TPA: DMT family transporter [Polyangiales bacterium]|nr:DMT family transporter [Polyangiales bacterium]
MANSERWPDRGSVALVLGLLAVSTSGPFFMMAKMSAFAAVFWRTALAGIVAVCIARVRGTLQIEQLRRHGRGILISGALLGPHFLFWVKAFELTDYASNLILLVAQPLFGALIERARGQALPLRAPLVLAMSLVGMLMVAGGDVSLGPRALLGDLCCIMAGLVGALFFAVGGEARSTLSLDAYMGTTLLVAAATALPVALLADVSLTDYPRPSWYWLSGIVLIATLVGHGLLNAAARSLSLFTVNISLLLEPVLSIALGAVLFGAEISNVQIAGGTLLIVSVATLIASPALAERTRPA